MPFLSLAQNQRGIALFNIVFILIFIGVLVASGAKMYGSMVERGKINDSKGMLEKYVQTITAWGVKNGRLPTAAELPVVFGGAAPLDAWGKSVMYIYDAALTATSTGGLCGRTATGLSNNAFALVSGGGDFSVQSTVDAMAITTSKSATAFNPNQLDLYRLVSLEELKSKAGCYGPTGGRLRIVNNELPNAVCGTPYKATIFADGGVPPYPVYNITGLPAGLSASGASISGIPTASGSPLFVNVKVTDSHLPTANTVQRSYNLKVAACGSSGGLITFTNPPTNTVGNNWNGGVAGDSGYDMQGHKINFTLDYTNGTLTSTDNHNGTSTNCIWYQSLMTLTGKVVRAYFNFKITSGEGFVFAMMPAQGRALAQNSCSKDNLGFGSGIPGYDSTLLGVKFDAANKSTCITTNGTACSGSDNSWAMNGDTFHVRTELDTTVVPAIFKVWICPVGSGSCSADNTSALNDISTAYSGSLAPFAAKTLTSQNLTDLNSFFIGFTTSQLGNNTVELILGGLNFGLF